MPFKALADIIKIAVIGAILALAIIIILAVKACGG